MARTSKKQEPPVAPGSAEDLAKAGRLKQMRMVAGLVHRANPRALPIIAASGLGTLVVLVVVGLLTGLAPLLIPLGLLLGLLVAVVLFGRFAQAAQYSAIEGQPGAAAAVLENMRGMVLVGEGSPTGLASLLAAEKKRVARVAYEVPIFDYQIGDGEGQVPISKLQRKIMRLPRTLKPAAVSDLNHRLKALQPSLQAPKGPTPRNVRQPKMPRPKMR
jgi:hypothetical protein